METRLVFRRLIAKPEKGDQLIIVERLQGKLAPNAAMGDYTTSEIGNRESKFTAEEKYSYLQSSR